MKKIVLLASLVIISSAVLSQNILNGNFEINYVDSCSYNLSNSEFNDSIQYVYSYGIIEQADILTHGCYVTPQNGDWCIGLSSRPSGGHDAVTLELSSSLNVGDLYEIRFWTYGNPLFHSLHDSIKIGLTSNNNTFGDKIYAALPAEYIWEEHIVNFITNSSISFISVEMKEDFNSGWVQVDNFTISDNPGGNSEYKLKAGLSIYPNPTNNVLFIESKNGIKIAEVNIYNQTRQRVFHDNQILNSIDLSFLQRGMYIIEVVTNESKIIDKLIIR